MDSIVSTNPIFRQTHVDQEWTALTAWQTWLQSSILHTRRRSFCASGEIVMLVDGFFHIPNAGHSIWKRHQITSFNLRFINICPITSRSHSNLTFQNVGSFCAAVLPVKFGDTTAPGGPRWHSELLISLFFGHLFYLDAWLKPHSSANLPRRIAQHHWRSWHKCKGHLQNDQPQ